MKEGLVGQVENSQAKGFIMVGRVPGPVVDNKPPGRKPERNAGNELTPDNEMLSREGEPIFGEVRVSQEHPDPTG